MRESEFIEELKNSLEISDDISSATILDELDEWDSLAYVSFIALIDEKFGAVVTNDQLQKAKTIRDLVVLVQSHLEKE